MVRLLSACVAFALTSGAIPAAAYLPQPVAESGSVPEAQSSSATLQGPRGPIRISGGVIAGLKLSGDDPVYPPEAKARRIAGAVVLHAVIGKDGQIESLAVISGNADLAKAAWDAVKTWTYKPYLLNGEPAEVDTTIVVTFSLAGEPPQAPLH